MAWRPVRGVCFQCMTARICSSSPIMDGWVFMVITVCTFVLEELSRYLRNFWRKSLNFVCLHSNIKAPLLWVVSCLLRMRTKAQKGHLHNINAR